MTNVFSSNSRQIQTNAHLRWGGKETNKTKSLKEKNTLVRKREGNRLIPRHPLPYGYVLGSNQNPTHFKNGLPINKNILPQVKYHLQWH